MSPDALSWGRMGTRLLGMWLLWSRHNAGINGRNTGIIVSLAHARDPRERTVRDFLSDAHFCHLVSARNANFLHCACAKGGAQNVA